jgi:hypothetical protein
MRSNPFLISDRVRRQPLEHAPAVRQSDWRPRSASGFGLISSLDQAASHGVNGETVIITECY